MQKVFLFISSIISMAAIQFKSKDSKVGIKETKEALVAVNEVTLHVASKFKDGVQFSDFTEFYAELTSDEDFKSKVKAGYDNYKAIPEEIKDVDAGEGLELAAIQLDYAPKIIDIFASKSV